MKTNQEILVAKNNLEIRIYQFLKNPEYVKAIMVAVDNYCKQVAGIDEQTAREILRDSQHSPAG